MVLGCLENANLIAKNAFSFVWAGSGYTKSGPSQATQKQQHLSFFGDIIIGSAYNVKALLRNIERAEFQNNCEDAK